MTKTQLEKFIKVRNKSDYQSNMQFMVDAEACGFKLEDLGDVTRDGDSYIWTTPHGVLREQYGRLTLESNTEGK